MNLFEKEEQTAPQRLQKEMEQALTAFMKDDVGLHLFEVPTGTGKTEVATNVMAKMLCDWMEKGTPMRRIVTEIESYTYTCVCVERRERKS